MKLHGHWSSPFVYRVIWALSLKAIPYQYVEEDLANKSPLLLHYNPVHKQVPVLVHRGKPISESTVILEYIDETWPQNPLLPVDPLQRATARFWIRLADDKVNNDMALKERISRTFFLCINEVRENIIKKTLSLPSLNI